MSLSFYNPTDTPKVMKMKSVPTMPAICRKVIVLSGLAYIRKEYVLNK